MCSCFYTVFATDLVYIHPQTEFDIFADFDLFFQCSIEIIMMKYKLYFILKIGSDVQIVMLDHECRCNCRT